MSLGERSKRHEEMGSFEGEDILSLNLGSPGRSWSNEAQSGHSSTGD